MLVKVIYLNNSFQYFRNVKAIIEKGATYQIEFDDETEQEPIQLDKRLTIEVNPKY